MSLGRILGMSIIGRLGLFGAIVLVAIASASSSGAQSPARRQAAPDTQADKALVELAENAARQQLGRPLELDVRSLKRQDGWAFLYALMRGRDGKPLDLAGTRLEGAANEGAASRVFCALLRARNGRWTIVDSCLGVTEVAWTDWDRKYGAPKGVFELRDVD